MAAAGTIARRMLRLLWVLAIVAGIAATDLLVPHVNHTTVALTLLMGVLGIAAKWGLWEAIAASAAAILMAAYFFFPPLMNFAIEDPQNWVAVAAFFVVSVVASQLSAGARRKAREAVERQTELEKMYQLSRALMETDVLQEAGRAIVETLARVFGFTSAAFYDRVTGCYHRAGAEATGLGEEALRNAAIEDRRIEFENGMIVPVEAGKGSVGSIGWEGAVLSATAAQSVAHLMGVALERAQVQRAANKAEAARQSQELKSLLLDAIAHDFKTPLTAIKFGASVMLSDRGLKPSHRELVTVVEEETDRMTGMISEAIEVARIEAGQMQLNAGPQPVSALMERAVARMRTLCADREVEVHLGADLPPVKADAALIPMALVYLLDNARKYSPAGSAIEMCARSQGGGVVFEVRDHGPGIAPEEREKVFERFYRGKEGQSIEGTGMGLSLVNEIVKMHGGTLWVDAEARDGAAVAFRLPAAE